MANKKFNAVDGFSVGNGVIIDVVDSNANVVANTLTVTTGANLGSVANLKITGGSSSQVLSTDGAGNLSWVTSSSGGGSSISNGTSNVNIPSVNGNVTISSAGNANIVVVTGTGANIAGTLGVSGTITASAFTANTGVFTGNGSGLSAIAGANVTGTVANATYATSAGSATTATTAGTVTTNAQPNITSIGTLTSLGVNGTVTASAFTANTGAFTGNGSGLSQLTGGNVTGTVANATYAVSAGSAGSATSAGTATSAATAGTVTTNAQPNITSVGTLTSLGVNGTVTAVAFTANSGVFTGNGSGLSQIAGGNVTGTVANATYAVSAGSATTATSATSATTAGTVTTNAQPNITSVGTLTSLSVTGNVTAGNIVGIFANGTSNINIPAINGNVNISAAGNANIVAVTGSGANVAGYINVTGNIIVGTDLYVGSGASSTTFTNPIAIFKDTGLTYVQIAVVNSTGTGSADITAYGNNGDDTQSWTDIGFTGNTFNDANYTVTSAGDGYLFVQGNSSFGGNLVIATGNTGTTKDIVFATGGFLTANIKARLYNANGAFSVTGNVIGGNISTAGQLTSTIATGTAPLTISSTTQVANLNVASSGSITNDTTTNSDGYYPLMSTATSGAVSSTFVSSTKMYYNPSTGQLNATNFNSLSDESKKKNIITIEGAVNTISLIEGVEFEWKDNGKKSAGVIAQQLETVLPHLVDLSSTGIKSVNYSGMIGYLIEAIKEQQQEINELRSLIQNIKKRI